MERRTTIFITRNSAIADKPRKAFRGQSRSPNVVSFHMLGMVSYYCPMVTLSICPWDIRVQKCRDLENRLKGCKGHWKCHQFDRAHI